MVMCRHHLTCAGIAFTLYLHHLISAIEVPLDRKLWFTPLKTPAEVTEEVQGKCAQPRLSWSSLSFFSLLFVWGFFSF